MNTMQAAVLEPVGNGEIALQGVTVDATLRGLLSEVTVTQSYMNLEETNIEAVYTFPLPLDAVLMELTLELNGEILRGEVKPKNEAEADYEDAIEEGDSAVLLTQVQPGLFTVNVGNLMAGEKAKLCFRYAQLHRWQGDSLRFHLPTTLAPRYGDPTTASGLREHEIPEQTLDANYGFTLNLTIEGELASANVECPSHKVIMEHQEDQLRITLNGGTTIMDRDFILVIREPQGFAGVGLYAQDKNDVVALASFHPRMPEPSEKQPRCIKLVIDCSGSMSGDSIVQARAALSEILELLDPEDWFNLTLFGSSHRLLFKSPVPADEVHIQHASRILQNLDADMGGTELNRALQATYASGSPDEIFPDVMLITDGEVWGYDDLIEATKQSGHRLFTVGVGSAVSESLLRSLAENSGGACELVSPNEEMAERIVRHFKRIHQPAVNNSSVHWPTEPHRQFPSLTDAVYAGDTVHVYGWFSEEPKGAAILKLELQEGIRQESIGLSRMPESDEKPGTLARMAAHARLPSLSEKAAEELAVEYQLVTAQTSCVLVKSREEGGQSGEIPALRKVPHQLAAGWGGMGSVGQRKRANAGVQMCISKSEYYGEFDENPTVIRRLSRSENSRRSGSSQNTVLDYLDIPAFLRTQNDSPVPRKPKTSPESRKLKNTFDFSMALNRSYNPANSRRLDIDSLSDLKGLGVDLAEFHWLQELVDEGYAEEVVTIAWLSVFIRADEGIYVSRHVQRLIHKAEKHLLIEEELISRVEELMEETAWSG